MIPSIRKAETIRDNGIWRLNVSPTMKGHEVYGMEKKIYDRYVDNDNYILLWIFHNHTEALGWWQI